MLKTSLEYHNRDRVESKRCLRIKPNAGKRHISSGAEMQDKSGKTPDGGHASISPNKIILAVVVCVVLGLAVVLKLFGVF